MHVKRCLGLNLRDWLHSPFSIHFSLVSLFFFISYLYYLSYFCYYSLYPLYYRYYSLCSLHYLLALLFSLSSLLFLISLTLLIISLLSLFLSFSYLFSGGASSSLPHVHSLYYLFIMLFFLFILSLVSSFSPSLYLGAHLPPLLLLIFITSHHLVHSLITGKVSPPHLFFFFLYKLTCGSLIGLTLLCGFVTAWLGGGSKEVGSVDASSVFFMLGFDRGVNYGFPG